MMWVQPAPSGSDALRLLFLLGDFKQVANTVNKNSKNFTETQDHWKLKRKYGFLQAQSSYRNEKFTNHPIRSVGKV